MPDATASPFGPAALGTVAATLFTTAAGPTVTQIISVDVTNTSALPITFRLSEGADAAGKRLFDTMIAGNGKLESTTVRTLAASTAIQGYGSLTGLTCKVTTVIST